MDYMDETVRLLNSKGYKVKESCAGVVNPYYIREQYYCDIQLQKDANNDKYLYIMLHGEYPVKYILLLENSEEYLKYVDEHPEYLINKSSVEECDTDKYGVFKVIWICTYCEISFTDIIDISFLPDGFEKKVKNGTVISKKIMCDKEECDELGNTRIIRRTDKDIEQDIIVANKILLEWAKELPNL